MLVSTTVVSSRILRPFTTRCCCAICTRRRWISSTTSGPSARITRCQGLLIRHLFSPNPCKPSIHEVGAYLPLQRLEAPVPHVLQDHQAQHHFRRRPPPSSHSALRTAPPQRFVDQTD